MYRIIFCKLLSFAEWDYARSSFACTLHTIPLLWWHSAIKCYNLKMFGMSLAHTLFIWLGVLESTRNRCKSKMNFVPQQYSNCLLVWKARPNRNEEARSACSCCPAVASSPISIPHLNLNLLAMIAFDYVANHCSYACKLLVNIFINIAVWAACSRYFITLWFTIVLRWHGMRW